MTATLNPSGKGGQIAIDFVGGASVAAAGLGQIENPDDVSLLILRSTFVFKTPSTGAANLSVGVAASGASATDILNALAVNGLAANAPYNGHVMQNGAKTAIGAPALWATDKYITFTGDASTAGLTGTLYLEVLPIR